MTSGWVIRILNGPGNALIVINLSLDFACRCGHDFPMTFDPKNFEFAAEILLKILGYDPGAAKINEENLLIELLEKAPWTKKVRPSKNLFHFEAAGPYFDAVSVLRALGAKSDDIPKPYAEVNGKKNIRNIFYTPDGMYGGGVYTRCKLSIPLQKLDPNKAQAIVDASKALQEMIGAMGALGWVQETNLDALLAEPVVDIPLGRDYAGAAARLAEIRQHFKGDPRALPARPDEEPADWNRNAYWIPPDPYKNPELTKAYAAAIQAIEKTRGTRTEWAQEIKIRKEPIVQAVNKLRKIFRHMGFKDVVRVERRHGTTELDVVFSTRKTDIRDPQVNRFKRALEEAIDSYPDKAMTISCSCYAPDREKKDTIRIVMGEIPMDSGGIDTEPVPISPARLVSLIEHLGNSVEHKSERDREPPSASRPR